MDIKCPSTNLTKLFLTIFTFPNSFFRAVTFVTGKLNDETLSREERCNMYIQQDTVFLVRILFNLHHLKAFDKFVGSHYTIQELYNLRT